MFAHSSSNNVAFLFPHQDDEVGVLQKIIDELEAGNEVYCFYFTRSKSDSKNQIRNMESLRVLTRLGVKKENILFVGQILAINDGSVIEHISQVKNWLIVWCKSIGGLARMYVPAWEGGHPDHDGLFAIGAYFVQEYGMNSNVWQFTLYNAYRCAPNFFRVQSPLKENGNILTQKILIKNRFKFIRACMSYPSEFKAWIGLFPFFFYNYLLVGKQKLQLVSVSRVFERPHSGSLYYEVRKFSTWDRVQDGVKRLFNGKI